MWKVLANWIGGSANPRRATGHPQDHRGLGAKSHFAYYSWNEGESSSSERGCQKRRHRRSRRTGKGYRRRRWLIYCLPPAISCLARSRHTIWTFWISRSPLQHILFSGICWPYLDAYEPSRMYVKLALEKLTYFNLCRWFRMLACHAYFADILVIGPATQHPKNQLPQETASSIKIVVFCPGQ